MINILLNQLNLNREGSQLSLNELPRHAHIGFRWQDDDWKTTRWFTQGMTGTQAGAFEDEWLFVAWYSKHSQKRGVRVSAIKMDPYSSRWLYRHILLVDQNGGFLRNKRASVHAGGLALRGQTLYLSDTLCSDEYKIRAFPLSELFQIPSKEREKYFNYRYLLKESASYTVSAKPTFISYDELDDRFITGSFYQKRVGSLAQFSLKEQSAAIDLFNCQNGLSQMQGACVANNHLLISQSYGRRNKSSLYCGLFNTQEAYVSTVVSAMKKYKLPPGIQDLFYHRLSDTVWTNSEFPHVVEYLYLDRSVFGMRLSEII